MPAIDMLVAEWQRHAVKMNAPASAPRIRDLEQALTTPLPPDVLEYFSTVDGMQDYEMDTHTMSFWSIDRILSDPYVETGSDALGTFRDTAFADFMICSSHFAFRVRPTGPLSIVCTASKTQFGSLTDFLGMYLGDPGALCVP